MSIAQQQVFTRVTLWVGLCYGAIVALGLVVASRLYVDSLLHLPAPGNLLQIFPIFLLFGAIIAYKGYSSVAYLVLDESSHLSSWTTVVISASVALAAAASVALPALAGASLLGRAPAKAHDWYPIECCHSRDCAPVETMAWEEGYGERPQLAITSKHGTVLIPPNFPVRTSKDGRMHVCTYRTFDDGLAVACLFYPPSS
jgi:hypothetical protein